jgi:hypothetical protein
VDVGRDRARYELLSGEPLELLHEGTPLRLATGAPQISAATYPQARWAFSRHRVGRRVVKASVGTVLTERRRDHLRDKLRAAFSAFAAPERTCWRATDAPRQLAMHAHVRTLASIKIEQPQQLLVAARADVLVYKRPRQVSTAVVLEIHRQKGDLRCQVCAAIASRELQ